MAKLLLSLLILTLILGIPSCKINEPTDMNESIPVLEIPEADVLLEGGEILNGMVCLPSQPLAVDNDNVLWINILSGVIAYYDNKFQVFDRYNTNIPCSDVTQIFVDSHNKKWFGNDYGDVFTYDNQNWEILPTPSDINNIVDIKQDNEGTIWVLGEHRDDDLGILWNYKDESINKVVYCKKPSTRDVTGLAIDSDNNKWIGIYGTGLCKVNGDNCTNLQSIFTNPFIHNIHYDKRNDILYISACSGYNYIEGERIYCEGGIYTYKDGKFELLATDKTGLPSSHKRTIRINTMLVDCKGNLWLGYPAGWPDYGIALGRVDNGQWVNFGQESPIENYQIDAITSDNSGRIWLLVTDPSSEQSCLAIFDGETWATTSISVLSNDPRIWWQEKELAELFKYPASSVNIEEALKDPMAYRGKKISFVGKSERMSGYAGLVDKGGTKLYILPGYPYELQQLLKDTGLDQEIDQSEYQEYIGYLQFGECYRGAGRQPYLFVTEVYPYTSSEQQKTSYRKPYESYVDALAQDKKDIKAVVDQWIAAEISQNIEELKKVYPQDISPTFLFTRGGQADAKDSAVEVKISDFSIRVEGTNAEVSIHDATVKPEKYCEPYMGCTGPYRLCHIKLQKYGTEWKITGICYAPAAPPAVTLP